MERIKTERVDAVKLTLAPWQDSPRENAAAGSYAAAHAPHVSSPHGVHTPPGYVKFDYLWDYDTRKIVICIEEYDHRSQLCAPIQVIEGADRQEDVGGYPAGLFTNQAIRKAKMEVEQTYAGFRVIRSFRFRKTSTRTTTAARFADLVKGGILP
jgi:hypothetical protein